MSVESEGAGGRVPRSIDQRRTPETTIGISYFSFFVLDVYYYRFIITVLDVHDVY